MESFYPKFGEVELVLVDNDNDFYDPLESNFECEDENEDIKLQLDDSIHEENQFNLAIDDDDDDIEYERDTSSSSIHQERSGFGRIKQEIPEPNCDYVAATAATFAVNNESKYRPIIAPKFERNDVDASDVSLDANDSHFYDNDSNYEDITPIETKPNIEELRLQTNKTDTTKQNQNTKSMVSIPGSSGNTNEIPDVKETVAEKKVNLKKTIKKDESTVHGNVKTRNKRKPKVKTKATTATVTAPADTDTVADADADDVDVDVDATSSSKEGSTNTETKCKKKRASVKVSRNIFNEC